MEDIIELMYLGEQKDKNVPSSVRRVTEQDYWEAEEEAEERHLLEYGGTFAVELTIRKLYRHSATFEDMCIILDNRYPNIDRETAITIVEQIRAKVEESNDKVLKLTPQRLIWVTRWANSKPHTLKIVNSLDRTSVKSIQQLPDELVTIKPYLDVAIEVGLVDENYQPLEKNVNRSELAAMIWFINQYHKVKYIWKLFQEFWQLPSKTNPSVKAINLQHQNRDERTPLMKAFIKKVKDRNLVVIK